MFALSFPPPSISLFPFLFLKSHLVLISLLSFIQWFTMKRQHALIVLADGLYYTKFREYCKVNIYISSFGFVNLVGGFVFVYSFELGLEGIIVLTWNFLVVTARFGGAQLYC